MFNKVQVWVAVSRVFPYYMHWSQNENTLFHPRTGSSPWAQHLPSHFQKWRWFYSYLVTSGISFTVQHLCTLDTKCSQGLSLSFTVSERQTKPSKVLKSFFLACKDALPLHLTWQYQGFGPCLFLTAVPCFLDTTVGYNKDFCPAWQVTAEQKLVWNTHRPPDRSALGWQIPSPSKSQSTYYFASFFVSQVQSTWKRQHPNLAEQKTLVVHSIKKEGHFSLRWWGRRKIELAEDCFGMGCYIPQRSHALVAWKGHSIGEIKAPRICCQSSCTERALLTATISTAPSHTHLILSEIPWATSAHPP